MKDIGAVIVTHNSEGEVGACLASVVGRVERVIVVDNASSDGTIEEVRHQPIATLVANLDNRGFAAAVNQGIRALDTPYILLLNPDAVLETGLGELVEACEEPAVGAAAGRLTGLDGQPQVGFSVRRFPSALTLCFEVLGLNRIWRRNPVNRRYRCLDFDLEHPAEVEQPAGAFLMLRREAWQAVDGFDEGFRPVWFEDVDFLKRIHDAGFGVRYRPGAVARHRGAHSVSKVPGKFREFYWYANLLRYNSKHFHSTGRLAVSAAVMAGCVLRMVHGVIGELNLDPVAIYGRVIRFACVRLVSGRKGEAGTTPALARR
jgi:N-acetylglucosaminyl-diphospho-decaprenol L-rhamnosyltransferase